MLFRSVNDHLGNQLDILLKGIIQRNNSMSSSNNWNIMRNRAIFSIKSITKQDSEFGPKSSDSSKSLILKEAPLDGNTKKTGKGEDIYNINLAFISEILSKNKNITSALEKVNSYSNRPPISEQKLLELIEKNEVDMFNIIKRWSSNMLDRKSTRLNSSH